MTANGFEVICEVEPATKPEVMHVRHQIGVMSRIAAAFLIPDNHIRRATVSRIAASPAPIPPDAPVTTASRSSRTILAVLGACRSRPTGPLGASSYVRTTPSPAQDQPS